MNSFDISILQGSYKISRPVLKKILSKTVIGIDGIRYPSLSKCEILTMLYFTQIADQSGYIEYVKTNELGDLLGYSGRNTYHVIENLIRKGFIESEGNNWTGYRSVQIKDNDYSNVRAYSGKNKYLNTNHLFFARSSAFFGAFSNLSLYAIRTFLYILYNYDALNGYRFSIDRLMDTLDIKDKYLCISYLKELEPLIGRDYYSLRGSKVKRIKYEIVYIHPGNGVLVSEHGINQEQDSYYKYKWQMFIRKSGLQFKKIGYLTSEIFAMIYTCLKNGMYLERAENVIKRVLYEESEEERAVLFMKYRLTEAQADAVT